MSTQKPDGDGQDFRTPRLLTSCLIIVMEEKGGVGKSGTAQCCAQALKMAGEQLLITETDQSNSNMTMVGLANYPPIDVREDGAVGGFLEIIEKLEQKQFGHALVDTGARDDKIVQGMLPQLLPHLKKAGVHLIVVRPLTTSHFVQVNAHEYATKSKPPGTGCVFVLNLSQGRVAKDYDEWRRLRAHQQCLDAGVIEIEMGSVGVVAADNAISFGLAFEDVAMGRFSGAKQHATKAAELFPRSRQLFLADYLVRHATTFRQAFADTFARSQS